MKESVGRAKQSFGGALSDLGDKIAGKDNDETAQSIALAARSLNDIAQQSNRQPQIIIQQIQDAEAN